MALRKINGEGALICQSCLKRCIIGIEGSPHSPDLCEFTCWIMVYLKNIKTTTIKTAPEIRIYLFFLRIKKSMNPIKGTLIAPRVPDRNIP